MPYLVLVLFVIFIVNAVSKAAKSQREGTGRTHTQNIRRAQERRTNAGQFRLEDLLQGNLRNLGEVVREMTENMPGERRASTDWTMEGTNSADGSLQERYEALDSQVGKNLGEGDSMYDLINPKHSSIPDKNEHDGISAKSETHMLSDLQKSVIMSEVLAKPKALRHRR